MYVRVSFPISSFKTFTYTVPKSLNKLVRLGTCVNAPINRRLQTGFIVSIRNKAGYNGKILKIDSVREKELHLPEELWKTIEWIADYYITPIGQVLKAAVPNSFLKSYKPRYVQYVLITLQGIHHLSKIDDNKPAQKRLLEALSLIDEPVKISSLTEFSSSPHTICKKLKEMNMVKILFQPKITDPFDIMAPGNSKKIQLSSEQQKTLDNVQNVDMGFHPYLFHGVTGSGKTEVYLKLAQKVVDSGKSVLVLVPEISLTPHVANRFRRAFGNRVALWHSRMTKAEKGWT